MAERGGQKGNNNATRGTEWRDAIRHELARIGREIEGSDPAYKKGLRECASQFIKAAKEGEVWAIKELGDRTDGKAPQAVEVTGNNGGPIQTHVDWSILPVTTLDKADEKDA